MSFINTPNGTPYLEVISDDELVKIITQLALAPYAPEMIPVFRNAIWKIKERLK